MKKMKSIKVASIAISIVIIAMFLFAMPLIGADKSSDVQSSQSPSINTVKAEEASIKEDLDDVQEEVVDINDADGAEEAKKSGDSKEDDETLSGGGNEDPDGVNFENEFEGIE